jgi:hypothetical protein
MFEIFGKKPMPFKTVDDVLTAVPKTVGHVAAELETQDLRLNEQRILKEIAEATKKLGSEDSIEVHRATLEIAQLESNLRRGRQRFTELQRNISKDAAAYAAQARSAVAIQRRAAAERVKGALNDYLLAAADLKTVDTILDRLNASQRKMIGVPFIREALKSSDAIIAECDADLSAPQRRAS